MSAKGKSSGGQLSLEIQHDEHATAFVRDAGISASYLNKHVARAVPFPKADEVRQICDRLGTCRHENCVGLCEGKDACKRVEFPGQMPRELVCNGRERFEGFGHLAQRDFSCVLAGGFQQRHVFTGETPSNRLVTHVCGLMVDLSASAPEYLQLSAQLKLFHTVVDCLVVNREAKKLYGVVSLGPFDEF